MSRNEHIGVWGVAADNEETGARGVTRRRCWIGGCVCHGSTVAEGGGWGQWGCGRVCGAPTTLMVTMVKAATLAPSVAFPPASTLRVVVGFGVVEGEGVCAEVSSWVSQDAVGVVGVVLRAVVLDEEVVGLDAAAERRAELRPTLMLRPMEGIHDLPSQLSSRLTHGIVLRLKQPTVANLRDTDFYTRSLLPVAVAILATGRSRVQAPACKG